MFCQIIPQLKKRMRRQATERSCNTYIHKGDSYQNVYQTPTHHEQADDPMGKNRQKT